MSEQFSIYTLIVLAGWIVLIAYWIYGSFKTKKTTEVPEKFKFLGTTAVLGISFIFLFGTVNYFPLGFHITPMNMIVGIIGDAIALAGIAFAIYARYTLGTNWSGVSATVKENHELIMTGPFNIVRHPIYTGFLFGMLGSALTIGTFSAYLGVLLAAFSFISRMQIEEEIMLAHFGERYRLYQKQIFGLIPFVW